MKKNKWFLNGGRGSGQTYRRLFEYYENKVANLEKENAELKKQLEMSNKVYNDNLDYSHHIEGQLTKAKDIIKLAIKGIKKIACEERCDFVNKEFFCDDCAYGKWIAKAEQFLKDN